MSPYILFSVVILTICSNITPGVCRIEGCGVDQYFHSLFHTCENCTDICESLTDSYCIKKCGDYINKVKQLSACPVDKYWSTLMHKCLPCEEACDPVTRPTCQDKCKRYLETRRNDSTTVRLPAANPSFTEYLETRRNDSTTVRLPAANPSFTEYLETRRNDSTTVRLPAAYPPNPSLERKMDQLQTILIIAPIGFFVLASLGIIVVCVCSRRGLCKHCMFGKQCTKEAGRVVLQEGDPDSLPFVGIGSRTHDSPA